MACQAHTLDVKVESLSLPNTTLVVVSWHFYQGGWDPTLPASIYGAQQTSHWSVLLLLLWSKTLQLIKFIDTSLLGKIDVGLLSFVGWSAVSSR